MIKFLKILFFPFAALFIAALPADAALFAPPDGKVLLIVGQDNGTIAEYVKATGHRPAGVMIYTSVQDANGLKEPDDRGAGAMFGDELLKTYPHSTVQVGLYMVGAIDGIALGRYDGTLRAIASWIKEAARPVYLRIGYEFDLPDNRYHPGPYIAAYRHIVDLFRKEGVTNAAYVWHSYGWLHADKPWMDWYPGDDYVDWFGVSIFGTSQFQDVRAFAALAEEHNKPFMIAESTPSGMYTARGKMDWFKHIFRFIAEGQVDAFCYINSNWEAMPMWKGHNWGDARVERHPEVQEMWMAEISQEKYLGASQDLFKMLGWTVKSP